MQLAVQELILSLVSFGKKEKLKLANLDSFLKDFSLLLKDLEKYQLVPFIDEENKINEYTLRGNFLNIWIFFDSENENALLNFLEMKKDAELYSQTRVLIFCLKGVNLPLDETEYIIFDNMDTLKLRLIQFLIAYLKLNPYSLKVGDDSFTFEGNNLEGINLSYCQEFALNSDLQNFEIDYEMKKEEYEKFLKSSSSKDDSSALQKEAQLGQEISNLEQLIKQQKTCLLISSSRMVYDFCYHLLTPEIYRGYSLLINGELESGKEYFSTINNVRRAPSISTLKEAEQYVTLTLISVDTLSIRLNSKEFLKDIGRNLYAACSVCLRYHIRGEVVLAYLEYLYYLKEFGKISKLVDSKLPDILSCDYFNESYNLAFLYYKMASTYEHEKRDSLSIKFYSLAISILEDAVLDNPYKYSDLLIDIYLQYGMFLEDEGISDRAVSVYERAIKFISPLLSSKPKEYRKKIALFYFYLGNTYNEMYDLKKALICYQKTLSYIEEYSEDIIYLFGQTMISFASISMELNEFDGLEDLLNELLNMYSSFYTYDVISYVDNIAEVYHILASFYNHENKVDTALKYYKKALKKRETLYKLDPSNYSYDLSISYIGLATCYVSKKDFQKSINYLLKAKGILEPLYKEDPYLCGNELTSLYMDLGSTYSCLLDYKKAEASYLEAIKIGERLSGHHADPMLAFLYNNLGNIYEQMGDDKKSENAYKRGLSNLEGSSKESFPQYEEILDDLNTHLNNLYLKMDSLTSALA